MAERPGPTDWGCLLTFLGLTTFIPFANTIGVVGVSVGQRINQPSELSGYGPIFKIEDMIGHFAIDALRVGLIFKIIENVQTSSEINSSFLLAAAFIGFGIAQGVSFLNTSSRHPANTN